MGEACRKPRLVSGERPVSWWLGWGHADRLFTLDLLFSTYYSRAVSVEPQGHCGGLPCHRHDATLLEDGRRQWGPIPTLFKSNIGECPISGPSKDGRLRGREAHEIATRRPTSPASAGWFPVNMSRVLCRKRPTKTGSGSSLHHGLALSHRPVLCPATPTSSSDIIRLIRHLGPKLQLTCASRALSSDAAVPMN